MIGRKLKKACFILAAGLLTIGCSDDIFDPSYAEKEFKDNFEKNVLNGNTVDPNHTWNTSATAVVTVTAPIAGKVNIYTADPKANNGAATLGTYTIAAGVPLACRMACPQDAQMLYVMYVGESGLANISCVSRSSAVTGDAAVDFGGNKAASVKTRSGANRNYDNSVFNTGFVENQTVPKACPEGIPDISQYQPSDGHKAYKVPTNCEEINAHAGNCDIYFCEGNYRITGFYAGNNTTIHILPGAKVTFLNALTFTSNVTVNSGSITIGESGEYKDFRLSNGCKLINKGTIDCGELNFIGDNNKVYNDGTFVCEGGLILYNPSDVFINARTLNAESLKLQGNSHFKNEVTGEVVINDDNGETLLNSGCSWVNEGTYITDEWKYTSGSTNIYNGCKLIVEELKIDGTADCGMEYAFKIDGTVTAKELKMNGPGYIKMGGNALLQAEEAKMSCAKKNYGIYGPESGDMYAIFAAENIEEGTDNDSQAYLVAYGGKLIIECERHFAQGPANAPRYVVNDGAGFAYDIEYTRPAALGTCSSEHTVTPTPEPDKRQYYYYAFEDLGATDDFDFNDVIIRVSAPVNGKSDIELCAAGGTLRAEVRLGSETLCAEVHAAFGEDATTMVNTRVINTAFVHLGTVETADPSALDLRIVVTDKNQISQEISAPAAGDVPLTIRVNGDAVTGLWAWPTERTNINMAYGLFAGWASDHTQNTGWYENPAEGMVVK